MLAYDFLLVGKCRRFVLLLFQTDPLYFLKLLKLDLHQVVFLLVLTNCKFGLPVFFPEILKFVAEEYFFTFDVVAHLVVASFQSKVFMVDQFGFVLNLFELLLMELSRLRVRLHGVFQSFDLLLLLLHQFLLLVEIESELLQSRC